MKIRFQAGRVGVAAALCALLLLGSEPGLGQAPLDAAATAALAKARIENPANFAHTTDVLTVYDRQGKLVRTIGEPGQYAWPAFSPDGKRVAVAKRGTEDHDIWVFDLSTGASTQITSDPVEHFSPVWSPDGSQIAYASNPRGSSFELYRKAADGTGSAELLYQHPTAPRLTGWSADGRALTFHAPRTAGQSEADSVGLYVLPLTPSAPGDRKAIELAPNQSPAGGRFWGRFSPDGRFLSYGSSQSGKREIWVRPFDPTMPGDVTPVAGPWQISDNGGLLQTSTLRTAGATWRQDSKEVYYTSDGGVMAVEIGAATAFTSSMPRFLFKPPPDSTSHISVSPDGQQFLFVGRLRPRGASFPRQITVFDRQGRVVRALGEPGNYTEPMLSPDGTQVAAFLHVGRLWKADPLPNNDIHVFDVSTGKSVQVTSSGSSAFFQTSPVWSPDGSQLAFVSVRDGMTAVYRKASDGSGGEELVYRLDDESGNLLAPLTDWSPDGRFLAYSAGGVLSTMPANGSRTSVEFVREEFTALGARFSPDSRYIAYVTNESGRNEVYVRRFDAATGAPGVEKWQVSKEGGLGFVTWRHDGRELYYLASDGGVMVVDVTTAPAFQAGPPRLLFRAPATFQLLPVLYMNEGTNTPSDSNRALGGFEQGNISRDGQRFVFAVQLPPQRQVVPVARAILETYVGTYSRISSGQAISGIPTREFPGVIPSRERDGPGPDAVTLEGNQLMFQATGGAKVPLFAESEMKFFATATNGDFEFVKGDNGDVKYLFVYRGGSPGVFIRSSAGR